MAEVLNNKDNIIIDVLACQKKGKRQEEIINGIKVYKSASFGKALGMPLSFDFFKLFFEIKNNYDLFILHYPFPLASLIAFFIPREKLVIYYHSDIIRQKIFRIPFLPFINSSLNRAKKILVSGKNIVQSSSLLKKHSTKCETVPFGINLDLSENDYLEAKKIKDKYSNNNLLLAIGRLVYYKGFEYAVKAMVDVNAHLLIIGQGPEEEKLKKLIAELKLENKITIIPPQSRLTPFLLASDIFIFPSTERSEAFGLVQIEAMAAGKPIINTYLQTAVEEVSLNGISGLTVEIKNAKALTMAINTLLNHETLKIEYGNNAKQRYQTLFTKEIFLNNFKNSIL